MGRQRPPGGRDDSTHDPERERAGEARQPWIDANRTQRYTPRRSIADRLRGESREPEARPEPHSLPEIGAGDTLSPDGRPKATAAPARSDRRGWSWVRLAAVLAGVIVLGLAAGAAVAWFAGWRPAFLASTSSEPANPAPDKPEASPAEPKPPETRPSETKPGEPAAPGTPPAIARSCFGGTTDVKAGAAACGFALDAAGAVSFQGQRIAERLAAGARPAQRLVLYPFSPSGRFVFLRACEAPTGGRCEVQRLVDTREKKIVEVKGGADGFTWVAWSPKEQVGLLGYRDGLSETIAVIATADGKSIRPSAIRNARNRYALLRADSLRWRDEETFSVEVKLCPLAKGRARNAACEKDEDVKYRRRTVKLER